MKEKAIMKILLLLNDADTDLILSVLGVLRKMKGAKAV